MLPCNFMIRNTLILLMLWSLSVSLFATNVIMETPLGDIEIELFDDVTPGTVANFLNYVDDGDYEGTFVHRSVPGFVIQGGGFTFEDGAAPPIPTDPPIKNEFNLSNVRGTIAMAKRLGDADSATSQWFINLADNSGNLDGDDGQGGGFFTVFGQVVGNGMAVADAIAALARVDAGGAFAQLPVIDFSAAPLKVENFVYSNVVRAAPSFEINPGVSGAWFNQATAGQGWLLDVIEKEVGLDLFVAWFTYDINEPAADENDGFASRQHRWFTAFGSATGDTAVLDIFLNSGGVFNDPRDTTTESVGTMTIQFSNCTNAQLAFDFDDSDDHDDTLDVSRLSPDVFCQAIVDASQPAQ
jgi:peptidyl-prolyl cis-trans isomerase A (cyclophilin A)